MAGIVIGLGEIGVTRPGVSYVRTHALGSCVAVIMQDPKTRVAGMIHIVLPASDCNPAKAAAQPAYFADTGIPLLLRHMAELGCASNGRGLQVKLAGGAQIMDPNGVFNIGKRNVLAAKKVLWGLRLGAVVEDVGDTISRTVTVDVEAWKVIVASPGRGIWEI